MVLFLLIVSLVYLLAFTRNHKTFLSPFFLLKFFEKTTKIFLHSFCFFFGSLSYCLFFETLKIFYLCLSLHSCSPSSRKTKIPKIFLLCFFKFFAFYLFENLKTFLFHCSFVFLVFFWLFFLAFLCSFLFFVSFVFVFKLQNPKIPKRFLVLSVEVNEYLIGSYVLYC